MRSAPSTQCHSLHDRACWGPLIHRRSHLFSSPQHNAHTCFVCAPSCTLTTPQLSTYATSQRFVYTKYARLACCFFTDQSRECRPPWPGRFSPHVQVDEMVCSSEQHLRPAPRDAHFGAGGSGKYSSNLLRRMGTHARYTVPFIRTLYCTLNTWSTSASPSRPNSLQPLR